MSLSKRRISLQDNHRVLLVLRACMLITKCYCFWACYGQKLYVPPIVKSTKTITNEERIQLKKGFMKTYIREDAMIAVFQ